MQINCGDKTAFKLTILKLFCLEMASPPETNASTPCGIGRSDHYKKIFPGQFDKGKWHVKIMGLGVRQTLRGRRWRASALWKTLNEVASPCSLTICRPVVSSQNSGFRIRDRRRWHLSFPYHWNQSRELCEQCNWRQNRGIMIGNRRCKVLAIMSLRMSPSASDRRLRPQNVRLLFAFCSHKNNIFFVKCFRTCNSPSRPKREVAIH